MNLYGRTIYSKRITPGHRQGDGPEALTEGRASAKQATRPHQANRKGWPDAGGWSAHFFSMLFSAGLTNRLSVVAR